MMKPGEITIGLERMGRGMADVSRVTKVGEIGLCGVSGNGMGVWGELAVVWLCGCVVVVLRDKSCRITAGCTITGG